MMAKFKLTPMGLRPRTAVRRMLPLLATLRRNIPFVLFIAGILAYGGVFAWRMLKHFDVVNLIRDTNLDDAFYYYQIARNFADGQFSTFDGINRTNGYHPVWMLLITPFYWVFDPETALFGIKAFEIMLVAGGVSLIALAARLARLPWILLFAVPPALYGRDAFTVGMEAAAALFFLGALFLAVILFVRKPCRWAWPLALVAFVLPWVRLEYVAISLAVTGALLLAEIAGTDGEWKVRLAPRTLVRRESFTPFLSSCFGIATYFAWNGFVFGGLVPVSGAAKMYYRQPEYDFVENMRGIVNIISYHVGPGVLPAVLEIGFYILLLREFNSRLQIRDGRLTLAFLICVFGLGLGHAAQMMQSILTMSEGNLSYSRWYYVPAYLMMALVVPVRCYVAIHVFRGLCADRSQLVWRTSKPLILAIGAIALFANTNFAERWRFIDASSESLHTDSWILSHYANALVINRLLPENSVIGVWDAGVVGYTSDFPVVELNGLVNSWDFLRARLQQGGTPIPPEWGITWFANGLAIEHGGDVRGGVKVGQLVYEGFSHVTGGVERTFRIWRRGAAPSALKNEADLSTWVWRRMRPHFDWQFDDVGVLVDGRLVQVLVKDCSPHRRQGEFLVISGKLEGFRVLQLKDMHSNRLGMCVRAFLLDDVDANLWSGYGGDVDANRLLGDFEEGFDGWRLEGDAVTNHREHEYVQQPIRGNVGPGFLTSYHPTASDAAAGAARSPEFTATNDELLTFRIAGGGGDGVGVRLLADGEPIEVWRGRNSEHFETVVHPLSGLADKTLQLEMFDHETGGWGHIMLDHVMVVAVRGETPRGRRER